MRDETGGGTSVRRSAVRCVGCAVRDLETAGVGMYVVLLPSSGVPIKRPDTTSYGTSAKPPG